MSVSLPEGRRGDAFAFVESLSGRRILGINPPVYDFAWFDLWAKPLGLLSLLGRLRSLGNEVALLDCLWEGRTKQLDFGRWKTERVEVEKPAPYRGIPRRYFRFGLSSAALRERLLSMEPPDVVMLTSAMTYWYPGVWEMVRAVREVYPGVPVILGGTYARLCPEHALQSGVDFVQTAPFSHVVGNTALDMYDAPGYGVLVTSWGCPLRCRYCAAAELWPSFRLRPLDEVLRDLDFQLSLPSVGDLAFYDDALLLGAEEHFYPLCAYVRERYPHLRLHTPNGLHVAQLDDRCCETLFQTGFHTIRLSLEGVDPLTVRASSGKTSAAAYEHAVSSLTKAGYPPERVETYILAGLPGQRSEDVRASLEFVRSLGGRPKLAEYSPIPGTPLFEASRALTPAIAAEPLLHNNTIYAQYVACTLAPDELQALKDLARGG